MRSLVLLVPAVLALALSSPNPALATDTSAQTLFQQKCSACHTIGAGKRVGPDLRGVLERRQADWLVRWITHPDQVLASKDPIAQKLLAESAQIPMPNLGVTDSEARGLLDYIRRESAAHPAVAAAAPALPVTYAPPSLGAIQRSALALFLAVTALIAGVFIAVARSTRHPQALDMHQAYGLRRVFFLITASVLLLAFAVTFNRTPYAAVRSRPDRIVYVAARQFDFFFSLEPIVNSDDLAHVATMQAVELPTGAEVEFRVTALDVNHNFALYGPERRLLAQTQAMPGYVNRLRVRLARPGRYEVLCLEYCGAGHHLMQSAFTVK
jgi:cytochrome c oxidase subunit II